MDTLHVGLGVEWGESYELLRDQLDACKAAAAKEDGEYEDVMDSYLPWGPYLYRVSPTGMKLGGTGGPYVAYRLEDQGLMFGIMRRHQPRGETPNVWVQVGAVAMLASGGLSAMIEDLRARIACLGGRIVFEKVSRVDPFTDLGGVAVAEFVDLFREGRFITRARKDSEYGIHRESRQATGFTMGTSPKLRVYDKLREVQRDPVKFAAWSEIEWSGDVPERVTRVEFQLGRDVLKSMRIDTLDQLRERIGDVAEYLASEWFRFTASAVDRRHTERAGVHPLWSRVRAAFSRNWAGVAPIVRESIRRAASAEALVRQAVGCCLKAAAVAGRAVHNVEDGIGYMADLVFRNDPGQWYERWRMKRRAVEAAYPLGRAIVEPLPGRAPV